ncbi:hypothetical protein EVAR_88982_1 [Eumeta japonica]|uniref:Uncharacterized protein n=1 Tax=Eumeta variegata TaxID=151549 RepID=A0A4C1VQJ5_EUMVA|nr:hypothetical protein EVAR_88982_1 [Eumeta japonica]
MLRGISALDKANSKHLELTLQQNIQSLVGETTPTRVVTGESIDKISTITHEAYDSTKAKRIEAFVDCTSTTTCNTALAESAAEDYVLSRTCSRFRFQPVLSFVPSSLSITRQVAALSQPRLRVMQDKLIVRTIRIGQNASCLVFRCACRVLVSSSKRPTTEAWLLQSL